MLLKSFVLTDGMMSLKHTQDNSVLQNSNGLFRAVRQDRRPIVRRIVSEPDCIEKCREHGNGITSLPITEQVFSVENEIYTEKFIPRETLRIQQTPQAYKFEKIYAGYEKAFSENIGISSSSYANTMMAELGEKLYFAKGSSKNIKITTKEDIEIFKAMLLSKKDDWLK